MRPVAVEQVQCSRTPNGCTKLLKIFYKNRKDGDGTRAKLTARSFRTVLDFRIPPLFLGRLNGYKCLVEQEIVDDFQCAGDEKGGADQRRLRKEKSHKQRANRRTSSARDSRETARGGPFLRWNHRHDIGLPRRDIHL